MEIKTSGPNKYGQYFLTNQYGYTISANNSPIRIGSTEAGDPAKNYAWLYALNLVMGVVVITKSITMNMGNTLLKLLNFNYPVTLHANCTGNGRTELEPNVPDYQTQLQSIRHLLDAGFPASRLVLRVDPITPTPEGLARAKAVLDYAIELGIIPACRVRFSVIDQYKHMTRRYQAAGIPLPYPAGQKYASPVQFAAVTELFRPYAEQLRIKFECCAEDGLTAPWFDHIGCVSTRDVENMGIPIPASMYENPQGRYGCHCFQGKTEILPKQMKHQCAHQCKFCYWYIDYNGPTSEIVTPPEITAEMATPAPLPANLI